MNKEFETVFNDFLFASGEDDSCIKEIKVQNLKKFKSLLNPEGYIDRGKNIEYLCEYGDVIIKEF